MGTTPANTTPTNGLNSLKDAGASSIQIAIAAGVVAFAVQAAVTAGKSLVASGKGLAAGLKS
ncbi:hypothetical protein PBI_CAMILLE_41 [Microbacterium phage Camille]|nr:hypothetical protein PBI_CAMILLE_41 [Microbacterium phage Camille]